ncbi:hypothetical protein BJX63DRAFT_1370 [Aspergillus granulosus]|uniref:CorA-like transporter domain-containing protein n=1 Tax=Aspergillus granulosus TaxID=176169 RepID=A0ABR4I585_9EURO
MANIPHEFEGWSTYPNSLSLLATETDPKGYDQRLAQAEKLLFLAEEDDENVVEVLELGSPGEDGMRDAEYSTIESTAELASLCATSRSSWAFFLFQVTSWESLQVSPEFLKKLFSFLRVRPEFLDVVFLFGAKAGPVEQSFSSFFSHCRPLPRESATADLRCSYDIGYNIKYAAAHGRSSPKDPFSIRETGLYHNFDAQTQQTQWIFLQAAEELQERVRQYFTRSDESQEEAQVRLHGMVFQAASHGWRDYLVYLEDTFAKMVTRGFYSNVTGPRCEGAIEADFADIRQLQFMADKLEQLHQVLQRNIDVGQELCDFLERAQGLSPPRLLPAFQDTASIIRYCLLQHRIHSSRLRSLISRANGSGMLVQNILNIRATDSTAKINGRMRELAEKNARETRSMSIVSLISAIFLPAMFLATLFGTNFFDYEGGNMHIASNFWIYVVIAAGMSAFTVLLWVLYQRKRRLRSVHLQKDLEGEIEMQ